MEEKPLVGREEEFEVKKILDSRFHRGHLQCLIHWMGESPEDLSWEPVNFIHTPKFLQQFHAYFPHEPGGKRLLPWMGSQGGE
uniref:Chromo domain-containing protein n=1 Tax=Varanus komodoensis TaxID=61221 RepID=A0A8D2Q7U8_VARKO